MHLMKPLVAACALACAGQAFALNINTTAPDLVVRVSGSSALQPGLVGIHNAMMVPGTIDLYYNPASGSTKAGANFRAAFGQIKPTGTAIGTSGATIPASLGGKKVLMIERAQNGSFMGVGPVARAQAINFMTVDNTCVATGNAYPNFSYTCANVATAIPDMGVSDVEPAMFVGPNLPPNGSIPEIPVVTALNASELANLNVAGEIGTVFGLAVSNNYVGTSISKTAFASILAGSITDWSQVPGSGVTGPIILQTRLGGSGTRAWALSDFLNNPCSAGGATPAGAQGDPVNFTTFTVVENPSTGGVTGGLNAAFAKGAVAIGIVGLDTVPGGTDNWKYIAIDGVSAGDATNAVHNAVLGNYNHVVENTIQWRNSQPAGAVLDYMTMFRNMAGDPAILSTLPGVAALPTNYDPTVYPAQANYIMKGSRQGNTCAPLQNFF